MSQPPPTADLAAQRAAMQRLSFLIGKWSGEARIFRDGAEPVELLQTEHAEYRLDGLLLVIEGIGRKKTDGTPALQALGIISYEDQACAYRMRAFNDGRYLETEVKLAPGGQEVKWGFALGEIQTRSTMRLNDQNQWTEVHEISMSGEPPRKFMEVIVSREK